MMTPGSNERDTFKKKKKKTVKNFTRKTMEFDDSCTCDLPTEDEECVPSRDVSRHFEDPSYGYQDFSRRGEHVPTFRVQVNQGGTKCHCLSVGLVVLV